MFAGVQPGSFAFAVRTAGLRLAPLSLYTSHHTPGSHDDVFLVVGPCALIYATLTKPLLAAAIAPVAQALLPVRLHSHHAQKLSLP
jgi:hypothetical protein